MEKIVLKILVEENAKIMAKIHDNNTRFYGAV